MKKLFLFAAVAGLGLVSASPPDKDYPGESRGGYPPCSRTVTDHCIQLYERGVRRPENLADNRRATEPEDDMTSALAETGDSEDCPDEAADRCPEHHRQLAQRIRRAGERG